MRGKQRIKLCNPENRMAGTGNVLNRKVPKSTEKY